MEIVTFVRGKVPSSKLEEFEVGYENLKGVTKPEGLIVSYLLQDVNDKEVYMIETVWESLEALEKMRSQKKPAAPSLFLKAGAKPTLTIYKFKNKIE
jgi:heme-degrading monooxygenase HmoA